MKTLIILNGELKSPDFLNSLSKEFDYIICADGGLNNAKKAEVMPDLLVGDLDSVINNDFIGETIKFPAEKDNTDCEIAIEEAKKRGADKIVLTCALGGRCDHLLTNLLILKRYPEIEIKDVDLTVKFCEKKAKILKKSGKTLSLIPVEDMVATMNGFKYPAHDTEFKVGTSLGNSNVVLSDEAEIIIKKGCALIFINE